MKIEDYAKLLQSLRSKELIIRSMQLSISLEIFNDDLSLIIKALKNFLQDENPNLNKIHEISQMKLQILSTLQQIKQLEEILQLPKSV
jgi:hypothetical protein